MQQRGRRGKIPVASFRLGVAQVDRELRREILDANSLAAPQGQPFNCKMVSQPMQSGSASPIGRLHVQTSYRASKPLDQASIVEMTAPPGDEKCVRARAIPESRSQA